MIGEVVVDVVVAQGPVRDGCHRQDEGQRDAENAQEKPETEAQQSRETLNDEGKPPPDRGNSAHFARGECVHHHRNVEHGRGDAETDGGQHGACAGRRQQEPAMS